MLSNKLRTPLGTTAGTPGGRLDQRLNLTSPRHAEQAEAKASAQLPYSRVALSAAAADRCAYGKPNLIACCGPINTLQHQIETRTQLNLTDDHYRGFIAVQCDQVTAAGLVLHVKSWVLYEAVDGKVERCFQGGPLLLIRQSPTSGSIGAA